ncbi:hypothetical protein SISNIDRAFT_427371 [Sistotremastrum niveocremeum HHB9708]|uniref:Phospholipase/carboxylesterase/thioesterase domain-containing protein n=1 Tax=Sistotremastrum niveocremeum HHB9708 TaxID=1314777 RepID=A0A164VHQ8_9AGAM|nr:hypothetical protein SISNIDRAFT_427371 [Sistotremastrum niveocremeum HHB9708]
MTTLEVKPSSSDANPRVKPPPKPSGIPVPFSYAPSDDGTDENLLILLHGLGDSHTPFAKLGRQLKLPQTATLALRAPELIPYLYEEAFQWYPTFDALGEFLERPNPSTAIELMLKILKHLTSQCSWPSEKIHLFGFAQGGTVCVESGVRWWRDQNLALGSIVTISGPLLSYPNFSPICPTPTLVFHRPKSEASALSAGDVTALKKGYGWVNEVKFGGGDGMPRSRDEWEPIMKFWSERLSKRQVDGLYEIMSSGIPNIN